MFTEHTHNDDEIACITEGAVYYDVREKGTEKWIRLEASAGDLLIIPEGLPHRVTLTAAVRNTDAYYAF